MRLGITLIAIAVGLLFAWAFFVTGGPPTPPPTPPPTVEADPHDPQVEPTSESAASTTGERPPEPSPTPPTPPAAPGDHVGPITGLQVLAAKEATVSKIGSLSPDGGYAMEAELTGWGGGVRFVRLTHYTKTSVDKSPFVVQMPVEATDRSGQQVRLYPFAARAVTINSARVPLEHVRWQLVEPGVYRIVVADSHDRPVLVVTRRYWLLAGEDQYDLRCDQRFENATDDQPLRVVWEQYGQGDMPNDDAVYLGDRRMLVAGYHDLEYNPDRQFVYTKNAYLTRQQVIDGDPLWHHNDNLPVTRQLVWIGAVNRYFAAAVYQPAGAATSPTEKASPLEQSFPILGTRVLGQPDSRGMAFTLTSTAVDLPPGEKRNLDLAIYLGPRKREVFDREPYQGLGFAKLIVYELGCALFTFQPLAKGLLAFLKAIHYVVGDWGVAIIFLVLCVRLLLHPITKRSQINMFKMSKQMQTLQPEIEKLKKKYKDDQQRFQQEQLKLWREKGISPVNMLGCLPMFLQTPIWVALYAMLYLAIELRHQPALYGVFQWISGGSWQFLGDLSSPDRFFRFPGEGITLNLYFVHPTFAAINILPILMAVVFYFQQKLTTPPPANEQAAQQQKIMKFMVLLFPVMLYSAPSGLTLYILASTFAGIVDSYIVRKHVKEQEEAGTLFEQKQAKPGGLMDRMQKSLAAKQQQLLEQQQKQQAARAPKRRKR